MARFCFDTKVPDPPPPQRMPDSEDPSIVEARRRRVQDTLATSSSKRGKTLSEGTIATPGTGPYTATKASGTA